MITLLMFYLIDKRKMFGGTRSNPLSGSMVLILLAKEEVSQSDFVLLPRASVNRFETGSECIFNHQILVCLFITSQINHQSSSKSGSHRKMQQSNNHISSRRVKCEDVVGRNQTRRQIKCQSIRTKQQQSSEIIGRMRSQAKYDEATDEWYS